MGEATEVAFLRFPMKERWADWVVAVHGGGGVVGLGLLQGDEEGIDVERLGVGDALHHAGRLALEVDLVKGRENLLALV